jgi:hypothetical protein
MELNLPEKQIKKIQYESMLLRMDLNTLYVIAPHLFTENITAANTESKSIVEDLQEQAKSYLESLEDDTSGGLYGY